MKQQKLFHLVLSAMLIVCTTGCYEMCIRDRPQAECDGSSKNGDANEEVVIIKIRTLAAKIR